MLACSAPADDANSPGEFRLSSTDVGTQLDLTGQWLFKPTHELKPGEKPEASGDITGYHPVPVPQMLSRIQWWLDDSEDYKKWEQARLDALGFDTEKSDEGWYRATIDIPELPKDRHVWIEFDGVAMTCKPYINGHPLGEQEGMFHRFSYDLTSYLKPGKNLLAVWVSMEKVPPTKENLGQAVTVNLSAAKVISLSKGMFGPLTPNQDNRAYDLYGIWQPVKLVVRGAARIDEVWFQPTLDGGEITITPSADRAINAKARYQITDETTNEELTSIASDMSMPGASTNHDGVGTETVTISSMIFHNLKPKLWTPADPNLYRLDVTLETPDGQLLDKCSQNVGFRTFEIKGNQFYLNGHPYWLRGGNQLPYGKNPWDPSLAAKLIHFLHNGNIRFTRTHATPWNEAWLDAADKIGLAVSIEGMRPWAFAGRSDQIGHELLPPPAIMRNWLMENADVVERCRNHPSVFIFTVGNEMLLRDGKNLEKWKLLSEVAKQTRQLAPDHPVICSSSYVRDPAFYEQTLKPAGIDDGDIDDMHRYNGWYSPSGFVVDAKFDKEMKENQGKRPLIGQEFSTGYSDLDTGLPVARYTRDLLTPQAWVGPYAYPGHDPSIWLDHLAKVTQRWAEELRFQRGQNTAGFALFSTECWFHHSYDPATVKPYPVYEAIKQAFAPVGLALETTQRRFFAGDSIKTNVFITNDDEQFRDLDDLKIEVSGTAGTEPITDQSHASLARLPYYQIAKVPIQFALPQVNQQCGGTSTVTLLANRKVIRHISDSIEVFPRIAMLMNARTNVIVIHPGQPLDGLAPGQPQRKQIEDGATAILLSPGKEVVALFPDDLLDFKKGECEYADFSPCAYTELARGLHPMDLKWWARQDDWRAFVADGSHRLKPGGNARELIRYIPPHGYVSKDKLPELQRTVMCEIPLGKGRLWICDLDVDASSQIDPAAALFRDNLYTAARDPDSTRNLPSPDREQP